MKILRKILLVLIIVLFIVSLIGYIFRHDILKHAFQVSISNKTNQTVEFVIGDLEFNVFKSEISISKSNFEFQNIYVNSEKTIELNKFDFNDLVLKGLSLYKLIFHGEIIAHKFTLSDPTFWFKQDETNIRFQENSEQIMHGLKQHPEMLGNLIVQVDEIEITQGKIDIHRVFGNKETNGIVNFRILLKDFNTKSEDIFSENKFLFAKHHFLGLYDLDITLSNGDDIKFDSLVLSSNTNTITISNLDLKVIDTSKFSPLEHVEGHLNKVIFSGINLKKVYQLEEIDLDSIVIRDGNIIVATKANQKKEKPERNKNQKIFKKIKDLTFGSFNIEDINLKVLNEHGEKLLSFNNLQFEIDSVVIDSSTLASKVPGFLNNQIKVGLEELAYNDSKSGINVDIAALNIDEQFHYITLTGAKFDDVVDGLHSYKINVDTLNLTGLNIEKALNGQINKYGVEIVNPLIDIDIEQIRSRTEKRKQGKLQGILDRIIIRNGNITVNDKTKLNLLLNDLELSWNDAGINMAKPFSELEFNDLKVSFLDSHVELNNRKILMDLGGVNIYNEDVSIYKLSAKLDEEDINLDFEIDDLNIDGFHLNNLISNNTLDINRISITKPNIKGFYKKVEKDKDQKVDHNPMKFSVNEIETKNGSFLMKMENLPIKRVDGDFGFTINDVRVGEENWIEQLGWDINLTDLNVLEDKFDVSIKAVASSSRNTSINFDDIFIKSNSLTQTERIVVNNLNISKLALLDIDLNTLTGESKPVIKHIEIENPDVSLTINKSVPKKSNSHTKFKLDDLPVEVDKLSVRDLFFTANQMDSIDSTKINVDNLDFVFALDQSDNLMDDMRMFEVEKVSLSNNKKDENIRINNIGFESGSNNLDIGSIYVSSHKSLSDSMVVELGNTMFTNIDVSTQLPLKVNINDFSVNSSTIDIKSGNKKNKSITESKGFKFPSSTFKCFVINKISLDSLYFTHVSSESSKATKLVNVGVDIIGLNIDSTFMEDDQINFLQSASVDLSSNEFVSKDSLYTTSLSRVSYFTNSSNLEIDTLLYKPRYPAKEFFKKSVYQTSRTDLEVGSIVCNDFDVSNLLASKSIDIESIDVYGLSARIFKDKHYPIKPGKYVKMPQDLILDIPRTINIDSINTYNSYIQYKELDMKSFEPGVVFLDSFNLSLYNISNDLSKLDTTSQLTAKLDANVMGTAKLNLLLNFQMLSPAKKFTAKGHMNKINFTELNGLTQNLVGITMKQGWGELNIPIIRGDSLNSTGFIYFGYKKLKIELFNREKAQNTKGLTGSMAGLLLNDIFIKSNNPGWLGKTRPGEVYFKRDTQKFVVNYIWRSIQSGLMSTMGYNNREQRQEKRAWKKQNRKNVKKAGRDSL